MTTHSFRVRWFLPFVRAVALSGLLYGLNPAFLNAADAGGGFYVAPSGADSNPGTRDKPFRTVEKARDAVRAINKNMKDDSVVELAAGSYPLSRTLAFGAEDSGFGGRRVIYRAAPGTTVTLSGGQRIEGWTPDAGGRFKAPAPLDNFRQLYVNGRRAIRARGPVPSGLKPWGKHEAIIRPPASTQSTPSTPSTPSTTTSKIIIGSLEVTAPAGYTAPDARMADWKNPSDIEFGYFNSWTHMICRVQSIARDGAGVVITMAQPGFYLSHRKEGTQAGMPAYIENALELLDEPGEWYFDRAGHVLYYLPRPGENMATAEVIAPALTTLLEVKGSLDNPVHDLRFEGITFAHATWLRPSEFGHPDVQVNFIVNGENMMQRPGRERQCTSVNEECSKSPANIVVDAARAIQFEGCVFTALGGAGIDLQHGASDNVISGCQFRDISGSAIQVGDVMREDHHPTDERRIVKGNQIANNVITRAGVEYQDSVGIFCGYTEGTVIAHNEIFDLPYTGVSVGWGWGETDAGGGNYVTPIIYKTPTVCRNNRIEYNHIHHVMLLRNDGGGVYTLGRQPGTIIRGNHIHDNGPGSPGGIYLDEGSADIEVTGNLVYGVARAMNYNNRAQNRIATCREHDNQFGKLRLTEGVIGKALRCGAGSMIEIPHAPELDPPQLTVEAWIRIGKIPSGKDARRWAVCKAANEWADGNYSLFIDGANVAAYLNIGGGNNPKNWFTATGTDNPLKLNSWQHIALTYNGADLRVYCDGKESAATHIGRPRKPGNTPLTLGARSDRFGFFEGDLDEVHLYQRALTPEELRRNIEAVRNAPSGKAADIVKDGLVGSWGFEDQGGQGADADRIASQAGLAPDFRRLLP
ncbi:MAG: right-handed parallel beta-helix repeat-containing protein [Candidatus Sumerlaeota bacterium]|nr:right-handed parallel beta-helix repeat-containing protein [Candidatus Sumerlaeota bacterium]